MMLERMIETYEGAIGIPDRFFNASFSQIDPPESGDEKAEEDRPACSPLVLKVGDDFLAVFRMILGLPCFLCSGHQSGTGQPLRYKTGQIMCSLHKGGAGT